MSWITLYRKDQPNETVSFDSGAILPDRSNGRHFRIGSAIRQGGNSVVWEAVEINRTGNRIRDCAVKMLKKLDAIRIDRFWNEVEVHETLDHPHFAKFYGAGLIRFPPSSSEIPWAAMDLGGTNLRDYQDKNGAFKPQIALAMAIQAAEAIAHLHAAGYIHRDIKPANFVLAPKQKERLLMIDFGLAKRVGTDVSGRPMDDFTGDQEFVGPQNWMSPELLAYARNKRHPVDQRSDLFQLGLLIWFFATNAILAGVPSKKKDPTGGALHDLVSQLVQEDPDDRPTSATAVVELLKGVVASVIDAAPEVKT